MDGWADRCGLGDYADPDTSPRLGMLPQAATSSRLVACTESSASRPLLPENGSRQQSGGARLASSGGALHVDASGTSARAAAVLGREGFSAVAPRVASGSRVRVVADLKCRHA